MQGSLRAALVATAALMMASAAIAGEPTAAAKDAPKYPHKAVKRVEIGDGPRSFWLFEPAEPTPRKAPVVVFLHGWLAVNPGPYGAWIDHLVRSGNSVIYPRYHLDWKTKPADFLPNALASVRGGLDALGSSPGRVRPDLDRFALIGHSAGGNLAALIAAVAADEGLPVPKAVVSIMPGEVSALRDPDLGKIPATSLLAVVAAEHDWIVGDNRARQIFAEATSIPPERKEFILFRTDRHGYPPLVANHASATAGDWAFDTGEGPFLSMQMAKAQVDALDRFGLWRLADVTLEAGFAGKTLDEATDHGALFRDLGTWSDGRAVARPFVGDDLGAIPRVKFPNGLHVVPWRFVGHVAEDVERR